MSLGLVRDSLFCEHQPPHRHPECPERIAAVDGALLGAGLAHDIVPTRAARHDELTRVHTEVYLAELELRIAGKRGWLDEDTYFSERSWAAALGAAGGAIDLTLAVLDGRFRRGAALVRPPGHHAESGRAMGFCLINNVACAAAAARAAGVERLAIVDWDVHHGNGTQEIFYADGNVLFASVHQYPHYPGTGAPSEVGEGSGLGATINVALPGGCGDDDYEAVFDRVIVPALDRFEPELVLVSAGFDAHVDDPLAAMNVTVQGFRRLARRLAACSERHCGGKLVLMLEGGYDLPGLSASVAGVLQELMDFEHEQDVVVTGKTTRADRAIEATKSALASVGAHL